MLPELKQADFQLTYPQYRYWNRPLRLVPELTLGPPPRVLAEPYVDVLKLLNDPAFLAWKFRQKVQQDRFKWWVDYKPKVGGFMPSPLIINPIEIDAVSITIDAVMKVPAVEHWLAMLKKKVLSDKTLTAVGIGIIGLGGGTGIALYETGRVSSLPEVTIPIGSLNLKAEYRKSFSVELEFEF